MKNVELFSFASGDELAAAAAKAWLEKIEAANRLSEPLTVALSGGRITQLFFKATVTQAVAEKVSFHNVHFFWADERCVPPSDPESNFKMAEELLLRPLKIAAEKIHRLRGEDDPKVAVKIAEAELRAITDKQTGQPVLDLIFLGMGEDGHVASLFPNASEKIMDISVPFLAVENSPKPPPVRISLSYNAIFAAREAWVLVAGAGKTEAFEASMSPNGHTPLARVIQRRPVKIFSNISKI